MEQGGEGAFCENCFLARNLPTCYACKHEISGAGDFTLFTFIFLYFEKVDTGEHILFFLFFILCENGEPRALHLKDFTLLTFILSPFVIFYFFPVSTFFIFFFF